MNRQLRLRLSAPGAHYLECSDRRFLVSDKDAVAGDLVPKCELSCTKHSFHDGRRSEILPQQCTTMVCPFPPFGQPPVNSDLDP